MIGHWSVWRRVFLLALAVACVMVLPTSHVGVAARRAIASVGQQDPTASFRGGVDFVSVDVTVTDQQGRPVRDLGLADFEVHEDGRRQKVSSFSLVQIPIVMGGATAKSGGTERVEPDVRSNERDSGRVYVLLLDDLHVSALRSGIVKTAARQFVERHLDPNDVAAVLHTSGRADASQEFTRNRRLLLEAIDKFAGRKLRSAVLEKLDVYTQRNPDESTRADMRMERIEDPLSVTRADQARSMLATLTGLGDMLSGSPGQRKAVVLFSEGLDYELQMSAAQTRSGLTTQTNTEAPTLRLELEQLIRASARANVSVYAVDPRGLAATGEDLIEVTSLPQNPLLGLTTTAFVDEVKAAQDSLRALSEETGGIASVSSNDFGGAFDRLVADNSMYLSARLPLERPEAGRPLPQDRGARQPAQHPRPGALRVHGRSPEKDRVADSDRSPRAISRVARGPQRSAACGWASAPGVRCAVQRRSRRNGSGRRRDRCQEIQLRAKGWSVRRHARSGDRGSRRSGQVQGG